MQVFQHLPGQGRDDGRDQNGLRDDHRRRCVQELQHAQRPGIRQQHVDEKSDHDGREALRQEHRGADGDHERDLVALERGARADERRQQEQRAQQLVQCALRYRDAPSAVPLAEPKAILAERACLPDDLAHQGSAGLDSPEYPLWGNGGYDVQHMALDVEVDVVDNFIWGEVKIEATATQQR